MRRMWNISLNIIAPSQHQALLLHHNYYRRSTNEKHVLQEGGGGNVRCGLVQLPLENKELLPKEFFSRNIFHVGVFLKTLFHIPGFLLSAECTIPP